MRVILMEFGFPLTALLLSPAQLMLLSVRRGLRRRGLLLRGRYKGKTRNVASNQDGRSGGRPRSSVVRPHRPGPGPPDAQCDCDQPDARITAWRGPGRRQSRPDCVRSPSMRTASHCHFLCSSRPVSMFLAPSNISESLARPHATRLARENRLTILANTPPPLRVSQLSQQRQA